MEIPKKQRVVDDKISIFGILGASKAVTNPLKELIELGKQRLAIEKQQAEVLGKMESHLAKSSTAQATLASLLARVAYALETQSSIMRRA